MQSLTNQKTNHIARQVTWLLVMLLLPMGCRERSSIDRIATRTSSHVHSFDTDLDLLIGRLRSRLLLMPAVARYKWSHKLPVEDPDRERLLIDRFVLAAQTRGLDADWSRSVIVAQITAARRVQQDCFDRWKSTSPAEDEKILDLQTELRPRIEQLTTELIEILARLEPHRKTAEFRTAFPSRTDSLITRDAVSDEVRQLAIAPWKDGGEKPGSNEGR